MHLWNKLWQDEAGFIISAELVVIATLLVVGLITGLKCLQAAVVGEMQDVGAAIGALNQSYCFTGKHGCWSWSCGRSSCTAGSCYTDLQDEVRTGVELGAIDLGGRAVIPPTPAPVPPVAPPALPPTIAPPCPEAPVLPPACPPGPSTIPAPAVCPPAGLETVPSAACTPCLPPAPTASCAPAAVSDCLPAGSDGHAHRQTGTPSPYWSGESVVW
jgi:Flp pilus assembly pilin Flp